MAKPKGELQTTMIFKSFSFRVREEGLNTMM